MALEIEIMISIQGASARMRPELRNRQAGFDSGLSR